MRRGRADNRCGIHPDYDAPCLACAHTTASDADTIRAIRQSYGVVRIQKIPERGPRLSKPTADLDAIRSRADKETKR